MTQIESVIRHACARGASDIHLDPGADALRMRLRVDGMLLPAELWSRQLHAPVIARLKVLAGLRTDEHQAAQDGRFRYDLPDGSVDVRLSVAPTYHGENAVLRILTRSEESLGLEGLGFSGEQASTALRGAERPHGMLLATGPTGSGKTTTLYALLRHIVRKPVSVVTIEDPVEYSIEGVTQIPARERSGLTIAHGLRSVLRQDPDVIMVGEIRDAETARLAVSAALTGHLVLSTLHTNDAPSALARLLDLGVEPYLVASTVSLVIAQRLVRRVCGSCRTPSQLSPHDHAYLLHAFGTYGPLPKTMHAGAGCDACEGSGYRGRTGIYELLEVGPGLQDAVRRRAHAHELRALACEAGMLPMAYDAVRKASAGVIAASELIKTHATHA